MKDDFFFTTELKLVNVSMRRNQKEIKDGRSVHVHLTHLLILDILKLHLMNSKLYFYF